ncbi:exportin 1 [Thecamonas trahens ATCC 50062]|uniref:Exportin-1 n=1 Tax=Thecamonas trahens ATCC 50062 TaxID=461836 RepID=A0A0L0DGJ6_THETB|nr:exportin 1 [Thecamonas trahens ATCC 50062]KNC51241.1 exportin 1 [Thecamonas trahens ATCC 50062]|eukprot:XP_013756173.1 exportin 1 [Thecamonas trahens ATCC 50062]
MVLARISAVQDLKVFRITLDYWHALARSLYIGMGAGKGTKSVLGASKALVVSNPYAALATSEDAAAAARRKLYKPVLSAMRLLIIQRMPKPEEVLVVEDENGHIVRERSKDTSAMALYKVMRDTLVFLTNLDPQEVEVIMKSKLVLQMNGREWSWANISTLCWAIGSISGAYPVEQEKRFLVHVIKDLLSLCEMRRGKDNKAVIAANIMYVVGQYPRFLLAHWKFLKTVVTKLFEFMHERHEGVQDMACDTFLKIAQRCRRKFVTVQPQESEPFIVPILSQLQAITQHLEPSQIQTFFEAIGCMIADQPDAGARDEHSSSLFSWPNSVWSQVMASAADDSSVLNELSTMRTLADLLRTNVAAARSMGHAYLSQLGGIYLDILSVYNYYSELISSVVAEHGEVATKRVEVKLMRAVKKEALILIATYVKSANDGQLVVERFVPPLMEAVLYDYRNIITEARDAEVLALMETMARSLKELFTPVVPHVLDAVFEVTLEMVTHDYDTHMDVRIAFFKMLRAFNEHCFPAFFMVSADVFKYTVEAMVWAMEHHKLEIAELGVRSLLELLDRVNGSEVANEFYASFFLNIMTAVFAVLTDTLHKTGFRLQVQLLQLMFSLVESDTISAPIFDPASAPGEDNKSFARKYVTDLLSNAFANVAPEEIVSYVDDMFQLSGDAGAFKSHMRDFLISIRQYSASVEKEAMEASLGRGRANEPTPGQLAESMALAPPSREIVMHDPDAYGGEGNPFTGEASILSFGGQSHGGNDDNSMSMVVSGGSGGGAEAMALDKFYSDDRALAVMESNQAAEDMAAAIPGMLGPHHPRTVEAEMSLVESSRNVEDDLLDPADVPTTHQLALSGAFNGPNSLMESVQAHAGVLALASSELQAQLAQPAVEAGVLEFGNSDTGAVGTSSAIVVSGDGGGDETLF